MVQLNLVFADRYDLINDGFTSTWGATSITTHMDKVHVGGSIVSSSGGICPFYMRAKVILLTSYKSSYWDCTSPNDKYSIDTIWVTRTSIGANANEIYGIGLSRDPSNFNLISDT